MLDNKKSQHHVTPAYYHTCCCHYVTALTPRPPPGVFRSRTDVQTRTHWGAPIMWDGMFKADQYDQTHRTNGSSVALTVFAVGRWVGFLRRALSPGGTHDLSSPFNGAAGHLGGVFQCNKHL